MFRLSNVAVCVSVIALVGCKNGLEVDDDGDGFTVVEDCNDLSSATYPGAPETCDGVDNNCDGAIDEIDECTDNDEDGATANVDCNDEDPTSFPGASERCDGADNNCNGVVDEGTECFDDDGDGASEDEGDCNDANANTFPGADEVCDGLDNDCDGEADEGIDCSGDGDGDGFTVDEGDCDDTRASINPEAAELCNGADENCNGIIDEGTECADDDEDGFTENQGDCDDADPAINPGAVDVTDGVDNDCDGIVDESESECDVNEFEPNDVPSVADPVGVNELVCGTIDEAGDVDWYSIGVDSWSILWLDVDANIIDSPLDPVLTLYRQTGIDTYERLAFNDDDPFGSDYDSFLEVLLPEAGVYYFSVKEYEFESSDDDYTYGDGDEGGEDYIYEVFTFAFDACDTEEVEPNDQRSAADTLVPGDVGCGIVDNWDDFDYFEFDVGADAVVTFDIDAFEVGTGLEAQITLYDEDGTVLARQRPEGTDDPYLTYVFEDAGTYYIEVESDLVNINDDGAYLLYTFVR